jgi:hypothetical protein
MPEVRAYRAEIAFAAPCVGPLTIHRATFATEAEARSWVEDARQSCLPSTDFACSVVPLYGAPLPE